MHLGTTAIRKHHTDKPRLERIDLASKGGREEEQAAKTKDGHTDRERGRREQAGAKTNVNNAYRVAPALYHDDGRRKRAGKDRASRDA